MINVTTVIVTHGKLLSGQIIILITSKYPNKVINEVIEEYDILICRVKIITVPKVQEIYIFCLLHD